MSKRCSMPGDRWRVLAWVRRQAGVSSAVEVKNYGRFDELVVDDWLHIEQMDGRHWWMQLGDAKIDVYLPKGKQPIIMIDRDEYYERFAETKAAEGEEASA